MEVTLEQVLRAPAATSVADVVERMQALDAVLPRNDGLAYFNRLYLAVTETVAEQARPGVFADLRFIRWLDVVFATSTSRRSRTTCAGGGACRARGRRSSRRALAAASSRSSSRSPG